VTAIVVLREHMIHSRLAVVFLCLTSLLLCLAPLTKAQQGTEQTGHTSPNGDQKLGITKIEPETLTTADAAQELTLSIAGACDQQKLSVVPRPRFQVASAGC